MLWFCHTRYSCADFCADDTGSFWQGPASAVVPLHHTLRQSSKVKLAFHCLLIKPRAAIPSNQHKDGISTHCLPVVKWRAARGPALACLYHTPMLCKAVHPWRCVSEIRTIKKSFESISFWLLTLIFTAMVEPSTAGRIPELRKVALICHTCWYNVYNNWCYQPQCMF